MDDLSLIKKALAEVNCENYFQRFVVEEINWKTFLNLDANFLNLVLNIPFDSAQKIAEHAEKTKIAIERNSTERQIEKMDPPEQVEFLISTLKRSGNIIPLAKGLDTRYKTYKDFKRTKFFELFNNDLLVRLILTALETREELFLPSLLNLIRIITRLDENQFTLRVEGGIEKVVKVMQKYPNNAAIQDYGCGAFQNIVLDVRNRDLVREHGGIDVIVKAMQNHLEDAQVQESACGALQNIALNDPNREAIKQKGGIEMIVHALRYFPKCPGIQDTACSALGALSTNDPHRTFVQSKGGIELIIRALRLYPLHEDIQHYGSAALWNLALNDTNKVLIRKHGGIQLLIKSLKLLPNVMDVQRCASLALRCLAINVENNQIIKDLGFI